MAPVNPGTGYWGGVTSSMDWCEENYTWTPYIAEFFNSWSSIAMIILGETCARMNPTGHSGYKLLGHSVTVVGIGSWLFHATLKYPMQMMDELPMLWSVAISCYISIPEHYAVDRKMLKRFLIGWTAFVSLLTAGFSGKLQFILFQSSFNIFTFVMGYMCWKSKRNLERAQMGHVGALFNRGIMIYVAACLIWLTDTNLCEYINGKDLTSVLPFNMQLHAWWHVLASLGLIYLIVLLMANHCLAHSIQVKFKMLGCVVPFLYIQQ